MKRPYRVIRGRMVARRTWFMRWSQYPGSIAVGGAFLTLVGIVFAGPAPVGAYLLFLVTFLATVWSFCRFVVIHDGVLSFGIYGFRRRVRLERIVEVRMTDHAPSGYYGRTRGIEVVHQTESGLKEQFVAGTSWVPRRRVDDWIRWISGAAEAARRGEADA